MAERGDALIYPSRESKEVIKVGSVCKAVGLIFTKEGSLLLLQQKKTTKTTQQTNIKGEKKLPPELIDRFTT